MRKKCYNIIHIFLGHAASGNNDRTASFGNPLQQRPIVVISAGHFDDGHIKLNTPINRLFIKWSRHRNAAALADGIN